MIEKTIIRKWTLEIDSLDNVVSAWEATEVDIDNISQELERIEHEIKPFDNNDFFTNVIELLDSIKPYYLSADENDPHYIRSLFDKKSGLLNYLSGLPFKIATLVSKPDDVELFMTGLVAASVQDGRLDTRDYVLSLNQLVNKAKSVGMAISEPIQLIVRSSSNNSRPMFGTIKSIFESFI